MQLILKCEPKSRNRHLVYLVLSAVCLALLQPSIAAVEPENPLPNDPEAVVTSAPNTETSFPNVAQESNLAAPSIGQVEEEAEHQTEPQTEPQTKQKVEPDTDSQIKQEAHKTAGLGTSQESKQKDNQTKRRAGSLYTISAISETYAFMEQQIYRGESSTVLTKLEAHIDQIEGVRHRYHEDLIVPLTLSGDALVVQKKFTLALDRYARARHVARVSSGLFASAQLPVIYREADVFRRLGDLRSSAQREEYGYEVAKKVNGEDDLGRLQALYRLAGFYLETYNYLAARTLYNNALTIHINHNQVDTMAAIPALQGIATSHRLARFPPFYVHSANDNSRFEGPTPGLITSELELQHLAFNNFPAGEKALQQIVAIRQEAIPEDPEALAEALLQLGDWHMLFGRSSVAGVIYKHVFENFGGQPDSPVPHKFADPQLIYFPLPEDPKSPRRVDTSTQLQGFVTLNFDVGPSGKVRHLKTAASEPKRMMDFRVRRSMRQAVFRPQLENGLAIVATEQSFTHKFPYFPSGNELQTKPETNGDEPSATNTSSTGIEQVTAEENIEASTEVDSAPSTPTSGADENSTTDTQADKDSN